MKLIKFMNFCSLKMILPTIAMLTCMIASAIGREIHSLDTIQDFHLLAMPDERTNGLGLEEVKFIITEFDTESPTIHYIPSTEYKVHLQFVAERLKISSSEFFQFSQPAAHPRKYFGGQLVSWPNAKSGTISGPVVIECMGIPTLRSEQIERIYNIVKHSLGDLGKQLVFRFNDRMDSSEVMSSREQLKEREIPLTSDSELLGRFNFMALNTGVSVGQLKIASAGTSMGFSGRDIVIFPQLPLDVGRLAATITEEPQTPLCHINLRAKQNRTPNAYVKNAREDPRFKALIGKLVRLEVTSQGVSICEVLNETGAQFYASNSIHGTQVMKIDTNVKDLRPLDDIRFSDATAFGSKAANVAELVRLIPENSPEGGFALPFTWYQAFMHQTGLQEQAAKLIKEVVAESDVTKKEMLLKKFRKVIKNTPFPEVMEAQLENFRNKFAAGTSFRCRSSSNHEDLVGFSGAGLYESYTHRPTEGNLSNTIKQVWASLWMRVAFDERQYHLVEHLSAAMAVLVHPNFDDERANGVAVTRNLFLPEAPGWTINSQPGENLVTNPSEGSLPEETLLLFHEKSGTCEVTLMRPSNEVRSGENVLSSDQYTQLARLLSVVNGRFKKLYLAGQAPLGLTASNVGFARRFAIEVEFKVTKNGKLVIKQARPWVE